MLESDSKGKSQQ